MNLSIILSLILVLLGIITSLSGSDWFWWIIILFPIVVGIKVFPRFKLTESTLKAVMFISFMGFFITVTMISEGVFNFGSIIIFIYLLLIFIVLAKMYGTNRGTYIGIIIGGIMISSIFTSLVDSYMSEQLKINTAKEVEADKIMKEKLTAINKAKKMNSSGTINTGTTTQISTGIISTGLSYPLIKQ